MIEEKVKELIKSKYGSLKVFSQKIKLPYTTVDSIFKRGFDNSNVLNIITICKELNISIDGLIEKKDIIYIPETKELFDLELDKNHKLDHVIMDKTKELSEEDKKKIIEIIDIYTK